MARNISQSPKERINVTYKTVVNGMEEDRELPLKVIMLGDYTGRADKTPVEDRKTVKLDKDNFKDVMASQKLEVELCVADKLSANSDDKIKVKLKFGGLDDMTPDGVVRQVPDLQKLLELRDALRKEVRRFVSDRDSRRRLQRMLRDASACETLKADLGVIDDKN
jgi:type VI secretion system protein ImpB